MQRGGLRLYSNEPRIVFATFNMGEKRLQFNPSTQRISYNTSTSKVQMMDVDAHFIGVDCGFCSGDTPRLIRVQIQGFSVCTGCYQWGPSGDHKDAKYVSLADPNGTYILQQSEIESCIWIYVKDDNWGHVQIYPEHLPPDECDSGDRLPNENATRFIVTVTKDNIPSSPSLHARFAYGVFIGVSAGVTCLTTIVTDCVVGNATPIAGCGSFGTTHQGGTMIVTEMWPL